MTTGRFDLTGRRALITGGSKGIGAAIARGFVEAGADVMLAARDAHALEATAVGLSGAGPGRVLFRATDMTNRGDADALAREAVERLGQVDILVNNAGSNVPQPLTELADETWDGLLELNLTSCMRLSRALAGPMCERGYGRIIYISSIMGTVATAARSTYCATKAALLGMSRAQACEMGPHGVTVNCISPGPILTDLPRRAFTPEQQANFANATAMGRWGEPDELAGPAVLLASPAGSYINGADLVVDGGVLAKAM